MTSPEFALRKTGDFEISTSGSEPERINTTPEESLGLSFAQGAH